LITTISIVVAGSVRSMRTRSALVVSVIWDVFSDMFFSSLGWREGRQMVCRKGADPR